LRQHLEASFPRGRRPDEKCQTLGTLGAERIDEAIGQFFGESHETVRKRRAVVEAAERDPERYGALLSEMDSSGRVDRTYRRFRRLREAEAARHAASTVPRP